MSKTFLQIPSVESRIGPVGYCIYCGSTERLSNEHMIPQGLGGRQQLLKASCEQCRIIIHEVETAVLDKMWSHPRTKLGLRSLRRKIKPPTTLPIWLFFDDMCTIREVPVHQYPPAFFFPVFPKPRVLAGLSDTEEFSYKMSVRYLPNWPGREAALAEWGVSEFAIFGRMNGSFFARMLAKIAHGMAFAYATKFEPLLPDIILGRDRRLGYLIGGSEQPLPCPPGADFGIRFEAPFLDRGFLIVTIRLFASFNGPTYTVVVGKLKG